MPLSQTIHMYVCVYDVARVLLLLSVFRISHGQTSVDDWSENSPCRSTGVQRQQCVTAPQIDDIFVFTLLVLATACLNAWCVGRPLCLFRWHAKVACRRTWTWLSIRSTRLQLATPCRSWASESCVLNSSKRSSSTSAVSEQRFAYTSGNQT